MSSGKVALIVYCSSTYLMFLVRDINLLSDGLSEIKKAPATVIVAEVDSHPNVFLRYVKL